MTMPDLLPCPFCGGDADHFCNSLSKNPDHKPNFFWVECVVCECRGILTNSKEKAADRWNTRAQPTYNPATHILIAREDVPDLEDLKDQIDHYGRDTTIHGGNGLLIRKAAALLAEKGK